MAKDSWLRVSIPEECALAFVPAARAELCNVAATSHMWPFALKFVSSVQSLSRVQLCDPMDCSMPGLPVLHQLPEFTQTHVHCVSDAIQQSHSLSSPSPPALNLAQHQGLFK